MDLWNGIIRIYQVIVEAEVLPSCCQSVIDHCLLPCIARSFLWDEEDYEDMQLELAILPGLSHLSQHYSSEYSLIPLEIIPEISNAFVPGAPCLPQHLGPLTPLSHFCVYPKTSLKAQQNHRWPLFRPSPPMGKKESADYSGFSSHHNNRSVDKLRLAEPQTSSHSCSITENFAESEANDQEQPFSKTEPDNSGFAGLPQSNLESDDTESLVLLPHLENIDCEDQPLFFIEDIIMEDDTKDMPELDDYWEWDRQREQFVHIDETTGEKVWCPKWFD